MGRIHARASLIAGLAALVAACTGTGIERGDAVAVRATLSVRPVADGDPYVERLATTAQDTLPEVETTVETLYSDRLPPVEAWRVRAGSKGTLVELVARAGSPPAGSAVGYEHEQLQGGESRWSVVLVHDDRGLVLGPDTRVKLAWGSGPIEQRQIEGVYLLLGSADGRAFEQLTIEQVGRRLAILDGEDVLTAPTVHEPIGGGQILIRPGNDGSAGELYQRLTGAQPPEAPAP